MDRSLKLQTPQILTAHFPVTSRTELIAGVLGWVIEQCETGADAGGGAHRTLRIRGEASSDVELAAGMAQSLLDEIDAMSLLPFAFTLDGTVRSVAGVIGWGSVLVADRDAGETGTPTRVEATVVGDQIEVRLMR